MLSALRKTCLFRHVTFCDSQFIQKREDTQVNLDTDQARRWDLVGEVPPWLKKKNLEIDIGFDEQIWCNFSRDKNLTERHAIQGSMKNTRFSGDMAKGVRVSFSRGTNEFSSLPSWVRFNGIFFAWVKKKTVQKLENYSNSDFLRILPPFGTSVVSTIF